MAYEIDAEGNLLEDMEVDEDLGTDALGNPIEKGGRPWKKPAAPISQAKGPFSFFIVYRLGNSDLSFAFTAAAREASKRAAKAAAALKASGTLVHILLQPYLI